MSDSKKYGVEKTYVSLPISTTLCYGSFEKPEYRAWYMLGKEKIIINQLVFAEKSAALAQAKEAYENSNA